SSRRRHTRFSRDWSSDVCSSDLDAKSAVVADNELFKPEYYINQIPTDQKVIDSIAKERNFAYYQLAVIYKEKFKEYELSKARFQDLLSMDPEQKLVLPSKYNLYKLCTLLGETDEAEITKNDIITNYPDSRYAAILKNQEYRQVIKEAESYATSFEGDPMVPKFELLKATAIGRLQGFDSYSNALNYVALNYANTPEGIRAQEIIDTVLPTLASKDFVDSETDKNFKIVYYFTDASDTDIEAFKKKLQTEIDKVNVYDLSLSVDVYNPTTTFVIVHGLKSKEGATGYALSLQEKKKDTITQDFISVSSANYRIIQIHKNFDDYLNLQ